MFRFQLVVLDAAECTPEVLAALELSAFFREEADLADLPLDRDQARNHYIDGLADEDLKVDYLAEPGIPDGLMMEEFRDEVENAINERVGALGEHYPFVQIAPGVLERKSLDNISVVGVSYLALQFYRALQCNQVEVVDDNPQTIAERKKAFGRSFANLFECIAGYAVSGHVAGVPHMTSTARSAEKFHRLLTNFCRRIGKGRVKDTADFSEELDNTNDGKVDCFVQTGEIPLNGAASIYLVGASIQKQAIEHKIMGADKIDFVKDFFNKQPAVFHGVLVRPQDEDELTLDKCTRRNCLLYSYDMIWKNMGKRGTSDFQVRALRRLDRATRELLNHFKGTVYEDDFDNYMFENA